MKLRSVLDILKETAYLRSIIKRYGDSLVQGRYYLFDSFRAMSVTEAIPQASVYFERGKSSPRKASIAKKLNRLGYYKNTNKNTTAEYEAFYSANNFDKIREVKLFSFERRKILTLCISHSKAEDQLQQYEALSLSYNMPRMERKNRYQNSFEISMVDIKPLPSDKKALETILDCTIRHNPAPYNAFKPI